MLFFRLPTHSPSACRCRIGSIHFQAEVSICLGLTSQKVIHLHGELYKACSERNKNLVLDWKEDIKLGDLAEDGSQLRPFIVWFGEDVPLLDLAADMVYDADILIVIGTSLQVYPAANLIHFAYKAKKNYLIDPHCGEYSVPAGFTKLTMKATEGMAKVRDELVA